MIDSYKFFGRKTEIGLKMQPCTIYSRRLRGGGQEGVFISPCHFVTAHIYILVDNSAIRL